MAVKKSDARWIRRDREFLIRNNFLKEDVPAGVPGPDILLSGDVERNPGPAIDQVTLHVGSINNMAHFMARSIQGRASRARSERPELHPCILPRDEDEGATFQDEFSVLDDAGDGWEV